MHTLYELLLCPQHSVWAVGGICIGSAARYCWYSARPRMRSIHRRRHL